jgi:autotransporter translocation and assembly factor TamB
MDASVISALSGLLGATIGGLTSGLATWLSQRSQAKAQWLSQNQLRRQDVYKVFIEQASKLYIEALQSDRPDVSALMGLYAQVSRMRVLCSPSVVECADQIVKKITATFLEPNKTFPELQKMANTGLIDPLREFSEAARAESERLNFGPPE